MIKVHCNQLSDFLRIYVLDWHVLCAILIPFLFAVFFPVYWFVICPAIWKIDLRFYQPRSWLIGYWLVASLIWFAFLAVCLFHMRSGHKTALESATNCMATKSDSTEDLFYEDSYLPTPDYMVASVCIQPDVTKWDYNYENLRRPSRVLMLRPHEVRPYLEHHNQAEITTPLLQPPPAFDSGSRKLSDVTLTHHGIRSDSMRSDSYQFDFILASLQNLAHELEKDFDQDEEYLDKDQTRVHQHDSLSLQEYSQLTGDTMEPRTRSTGHLVGDN